MTAQQSSPRHSWREVFTVYTRPRVLSLFFLGFAAGLPRLLIFSSLSLWLRAAVTYFSWAARHTGSVDEIDGRWGGYVNWRGRDKRANLAVDLGYRAGDRNMWMLPRYTCIAIITAVGLFKD